MLCQSQLSTGKPQKPTLIYADVQSQHTLLAKCFFPVQQFCMSSYKVLLLLPSVCLVGDLGAFTECVQVYMLLWHKLSQFVLNAVT